MTVAVPEGDVVPVVLHRAAAPAWLLERVDDHHAVPAMGEQRGRREAPEGCADDDDIDLLRHAHWWPGRWSGGTSTQWVPR